MSNPAPTSDAYPALKNHPFLGPDALYKDRPSTWDIKREQPHHRIIILLKAQGFSNREIAKQMEMDPVTISQVLRQPWARERLLKILEEKGGSAVESFIKGEAINSLQTLVEVRDDPMSGAPARVSASNSLLDRYLGKAVQRTENLSVSAETSLAELDSRLARLRAEEKTLLGREITLPQEPHDDSRS
jgi:lambda repressor-like predicted transcriptional regulator